MSKYIISRVKPAVGYHIDIVDGVQIGRKVAEVRPSKEYVNVFYVVFEGNDVGVWVLYLQRLCDA